MYLVFCMPSDPAVGSVPVYSRVICRRAAVLLVLAADSANSRTISMRLAAGFGFAHFFVSHHLATAPQIVSKITVGVVGSWSKDYGSQARDESRSSRRTTVYLPYHASSIARSAPTCSIGIRCFDRKIQSAIAKYKIA